MLKLHWDGSFNTVNKFLANLPGSYRREMRAAMRNFGNDTLIDLQTRIASGNTAPPLNPTYRDWKVRNGFDPGTLLRTREYRYHIRVDATDTGFNIYPFGSEPPITYTPKSGPNKGVEQTTKVQRTYEEIASLLEYGSKKMPPRPHWAPTARRARARFPNVVWTAVDAAFQRARRSDSYAGSTFDFRVSQGNRHSSLFSGGEDE